MRIKVMNSDINRALSMVYNAYDAHPVKSCFEGILFETFEGGLLVTCTNGNMTVRAKVSATVEEDGIALLPGKLFTDIMRGQQSGIVGLRADNDNMRAVIRTTGTVTNIACLSAEDYPDIQDIEKGEETTVKGSVLKEMISAVVFAASSGDESRKILTGVLLELKPDSMKMVALDGFKLALSNYTGENGSPDTDVKRCAVIPANILNTVGRMIPDDDTPIRIRFSAQGIQFDFEDISINTTLLEGNFIDYNRILPTDFTTRIRVNRQDFAQAISRCTTVASFAKDRIVNLKISEDGEVEMTSSSEQADTRDTVMVEIDGKELTIAFNVSYINEIISHIKSEYFRMNFNTKISPCLILPDEGESRKYLLLPVRVASR